MEETSLPMWFWAIYWPVVILNIASVWKLYLKANQPGWASIIPIYNTVVMMKIIGRPVWWVLLMFVPLVNFVIGIIVSYEFMKAYGQDNFFFFLGILILSFIFMPILAFGNYNYVGPNAKKPKVEDPNQMPPPPPMAPRDPNAL